MPKFRAFYEDKMYGVKAVIWTSRGLYVTLDEGNKAGRRVHGAVLMQSTGLLDVNGKEIFEGDVVSFEDASDNENVFVNQGAVEIHQLGWHFSNRVSVDMEDLLNGHALDCEVIGNIYENPELIEEVEND